MESPTPCPNCASPVPVGRLICPHCGAFLAPPVVWPPPPGGFAQPPAPPAERLLTGRRWLDFVLGFVPPPVLVVLFVAAGGQGRDWLTALLGVGCVGSAVAHFALQRRFPVLARGIGWGLAAIPIGVGLLLLGAFAVCLYGGRLFGMSQAGR